MISFTIGLDILKVKKVVLHMFFSHNYQRIKIDSNDSLLLEKRLTLHNVKSIFNKSENHYYYNMFLEKCSYQLSKINYIKLVSV